MTTCVVLASALGQVWKEAVQDGRYSEDGAHHPADDDDDNERFRDSDNNADRDHNNYYNGSYQYTLPEEMLL